MHLFFLDLRDLLKEIERRKVTKEDPCEYCNTMGLYDGKVCIDCLGQGVLLTRLEYDGLLEIAQADDDAVHA